MDILGPLKKPGDTVVVEPEEFRMVFGHHIMEDY